MQKLSLSDFEHSINPATWETADELVQAGKVKNLREIERHFWVALVETDEGDYEAEVMITPHKIKAYACECFGEGRKLMCAHIAATLIRLRQFLEQRAEIKRLKAEQKPASELTRFTVQAALENAGPEALIAFVKDYARKDKDFALALKTRFASLVTASENPYALVLDSVIPKPGTLSNLREPEFRRLRKALDGLEEQQDFALEHLDYRNMYLISTAFFAKIPFLLGKTDGNRRAVLLHFCQKAFQVWVKIDESAPSPELKETLWNTLFDLGAKEQFPAELSRDAIQFLSKSAKDNARFEQLNQLFDQSPYPASNFILQLFLTALAVRNQPEATVRVLADYISRPDMVKEAFLQLYYLKHWDAATLIGEHFLQNQTFSAGQIREIENVLLFMAEQQGDRKRQVHWLRHRFLIAGHQELFDKLKAAAGDDWPEERQLLLQELEAKKDVAKMAALLATEMEKDRLSVLLEESGDLNLLQRYEDLYLQDQKAFIQRMYVHMLSIYLKDHFGTPAAQHIRLRLSDLLFKGETEMVVHIIRELTVLFPERLSLPAELAELFPKSKRKEI
ncbi:MAG TPA: hypothetical protein VK168_08165 [Saprospiraceae bacterium]|nr:hypothetical protein [Saprospiraceae bacterium]